MSAMKTQRLNCVVSGEVMRQWAAHSTYTPSPPHMTDRYEELKGEVSKLEQQRDQTLADFESLEKSFADLHQRYLKLKSTAQTLQKVSTWWVVEK